MRPPFRVPLSTRHSLVRIPVRRHGCVPGGRGPLAVRVGLLWMLLCLGGLGLVPADAVAADAVAADAMSIDGHPRVADAAGVRGSDAGAAADIDVPGFPWRWPVDGARHVVEPFRAPAHDYGPGHRGMDIAAAPGGQVHAPTDGVVAFRGTVVDRPLVTIDHGAGFVSTWEPVSSSLTPGDVVTAGAVIGSVAEGGHTVRGAMHIGVRVDGEYVNPLPLFGHVPRAVLLPCC